MKVAFVSGHGDVTPEEFEEHYLPRLQKALDAGHRFVVGDYHGVDQMAQWWLHRRCADVTVFHMFKLPRYFAGAPFRMVGGFPNDGARDAAMTGASDYDIAWIRPGKEGSGTAANVERRCGRDKTKNSQ